MSAGDGPRQRGRRGPSQGSSRSTHGLCPCWGTRSQHRRQGRVGQAEAWPARPRAQTRGWGRGAPTAPEAGGAPAAGLTAVDVREALRGDGVGRVLVDVLQAQAGQLRLVEEARLRRAARQRPVSALGAWAPTGCRARGWPQPRAERSPARAPSKRRGTQRRTAAGMVGRANPGEARPGPSRGPRTTSGTRKSVPETCCVRNHAWGGGAREGTPGLGPPRTPGRALCSGPGQGTARGHSPQQVAGNSPHVTVRALALQSNSGRSEPKAKSWQIQLVWRGLRLSWEGASTCAQVPPASPARKAIWLSTQSPRDLLKETKATAFLPTPEP